MIDGLSTIEHTSVVSMTSSQQEYDWLCVSRRQFARCGEELRREGLEEEAELFSLRKPEVQLHDLGNYRYCRPKRFQHVTEVVLKLHVQKYMFCMAKMHPSDAEGGPLDVH